MTEGAGRSQVYFVYDGTKHIKIGISGKPATRLASLQTGTPQLLKLLHSVPGTENDEAFLHHIFTPDRVSGEWFQAHNGLYHFVEYLKGEGATLCATEGVQEALHDWIDICELERRYGRILYQSREWAVAVQTTRQPSVPEYETQVAESA